MAVHFSISVSLPVYKALTARLEEGLGYDDLLRDLLGIDSVVEPDDTERPFPTISDALQQAAHQRSGRGGFFSRGLWLPNGTKLRARYKQTEYNGQIKDNCWVDQAGTPHASPSAAATAITNTNVNGLRFWEARRPGDSAWRRLDQIVAS